MFASPVIPIGASASNSVLITSESMVAVQVPVMEATTAALYLEATPTVDLNVPDASCTFVPVYDGQGARLAVPIPVLTGCWVSLEPNFCLIPGRVRFVAVTSGGVAVAQATAARTLTAITRRIS